MATLDELFGEDGTEKGPGGGLPNTQNTAVTPPLGGGVHAPSPGPQYGRGPHTLKAPFPPAEARPLVPPTIPDPPRPPVQNPVASEDLTVDQLLAGLPFAYLSGAAGTGKTTLARQVIQRRPDETLFCATTGIAAVNLGDAVTINAALSYFDTRSLMEHYASGFLQYRLRMLRRSGIRIILIDEISMMEADQLTILCQAIDELDLKKTYDQDLEQVRYEADDDGRLKLLLVGDFAQLPPIKADFAFESPEWGRFREFTLSTIRRQGDQDFVRALQAVRKGHAQVALPILEPRFASTLDFDFKGTTIVPKNDAVDRINNVRHAKLVGRLLTYKTIRSGEQQKDWIRLIPEEVGVKVGALVMILANKPYPRVDDEPTTGYYYVNGDLATVVDLDPNGIRVMLHRTFEEVVVTPAIKEWKEATGKKTPRWTIKGTVTYMPLRLAYATTVHKCCKADTRVPVVGRGLIPLARVHLGDVTPYGRVIGTAHATKPAFRITTKRGYAVTCSGEHRWLLSEGLRETARLRTGDRIELVQAFHLQGDDTALYPEFAWWLGILVGDGYYANADHHIELTNDEPRIRARFATQLEGRGLRIQKTAANRVRHQSKVFRQYLEGIGLARVTARQKCIPEKVWGGGTPIWGAFLAGLYDADGSVSTKRVCLTTVSPQLAEEVQLLLLYLGVPSKRTVFSTGYKGRGDVYYQVNIAPAYMEKFFRAVPLFHPKKAAAAARFNKQSYNRVLHPFDGFDVVDTVKDVGEVVEMVDIELSAAPHLCAFGPFLGHNSQGLSLDEVQISIVDGFFAAPGMLYVALSRARTLEGLRIVGNEKMFLGRAGVHPKVVRWL